MENWQQSELTKRQEQKRREVREQNIRSSLCSRRVSMLQQQTYQNLARLLQSLNQPQDLETYFQNLSQLLHGDPLDNQKLGALLTPQALPLYSLIRKHKSLTSFEILSRMLSTVNEQALGELLNDDLLGFLQFSIEKSNYSRAAILALAELTRRSSQKINFRNFIIFNGLPMSVDNALKGSQELAGASCVFFEAMTRTPLTQTIAQPLIKTHLTFLKDKRVPKDELLKGFCNCLKWNEKWVDDLLKDTFIEGLLWIAAEHILLEEQIRTFVYCFVLMTTQPTQRPEWLRKYIKEITQLMKSILETDRLNSDVLFILSNLFGEVILAQEISSALHSSSTSDNIVKTLVQVAQRHNSSDSIEALTALHNLLNLIQLDSISEIILRSGLLEMIYGRVEAAGLYSAGQMELTLEVLDCVLDSPVISQAMRSSGMQDFLEQALRKISD